MNYLFYLQAEIELKSTTAQNQSQSYLTTDGQSASMSWRQATFWDLRSIVLPPWKFL
jgi:hypothetical protein